MFLKKHVDFLLIGEKNKRHYFLIKDVGTFMYDHTLHSEIKHFCLYFLQDFSTEEIFKLHIKDCFNINGKQKIYADFGSILVPEDNGKQNPNESYTNKYQKHVVCSYGYKLVSVDDKFSKPVSFYLAKDAVYSFINSMTDGSKLYSDVMIKHFKKELTMTQEDDEDFENSTKCWIFGADYFYGDVKVRDNCHFTGKYRGSLYRDCNVNVKLNDKIPVVLHNLQNMIPILLCKN